MSRNLLEYPITIEEVCETLSRAYRRAEGENLVGGQEEYIVAKVIEIMRREFRHEDFNPTVGNNGSQS